MIKLSKVELEEEIRAVENVLEVHKAGVKQNQEGIKFNTFILQLLQRELEKLK